MIQIFIRYDNDDKKDADRIKKGLNNMQFNQVLNTKDTQDDKVTREIWNRE